MNLSLYSAATGMEAQELNLNTIANNLANVNTPGFKKSKIEFQDLMYQKTRAAGAESGSGDVVPTGVEVGNGTKVAATSKVFTQGQVTQTSQQLDLAIQGDGFFQVQRPDGTIAYTRDGIFQSKCFGSGRYGGRNAPTVVWFQNIQTGATSVSIDSGGDVTVQGPRNGTQSFYDYFGTLYESRGLR